MKAKSIFILFSVLFTLHSCILLDIESEETLSLEEQTLTKDKWILNKVEHYAPNGDLTITEQYNGESILEFYKDHTYKDLYKGDVMDQGKWSYDSNTKILKLKDQNMEVFKLDDTHLYFKHTEVNNAFEKIYYTRAR